MPGRTLMNETALLILAELPAGTELSASALQREVNLRLGCRPQENTLPWRRLLAHLARLGRVRGVGCGLYRTV